MNTVIVAENLGKRYILRHQVQERYTTLRDVLTNNTLGLFKWMVKPNASVVKRTKNDEFWALKNVSFAIEKGDRVGIIGRNGAGKSTLLKVLSRITEPTTGRAKLKGRVASLLEVGTGFHPELTGRENIFLNGAILGMSKIEIRKNFDEIVSFAEVERFLDTPVKRYSSGMYVRLAFSVAAHLNPDILIVDEVLAVGDTQFQNKCVGRMGEVSKSGKTVLFVSHNLPTVQRLCNKGIHIDSGKIENIDEISAVITRYQQTISGKLPGKNLDIDTGVAKFVYWKCAGQKDPLEHSCYSRDTCTLEFTLKSKRIILNAFIGLAIWSEDGKLILAASSLDNDGRYLEIIDGTYKIYFKVRLPIKAGTYQFDISLNSKDHGQIDRWLAEPRIVVLPKLSTTLPENWHGLLNEIVEFNCSKIS